MLSEIVTHLSENPMIIASSGREGGLERGEGEEGEKGRGEGSERGRGRRGEERGVREGGGEGERRGE